MIFEIIAQQFHLEKEPRLLTMLVATD